MAIIADIYADYSQFSAKTNVSAHFMTNIVIKSCIYGNFTVLGLIMQKFILILVVSKH